MTRVKRIAAVVVIALIGTQLVHMAEAAAAVPGLVRASGISANDASDEKVATAHCPDGKVVLSAGYQINGATGEAVVDNLPLTTESSVRVTAYEEDPIDDNWNVTVYAICATLPGLVRKTDTSMMTSQGFKPATAKCPLGKVALGGGFVLTGATGEALVDDILPNGGTSTAPTTIATTAYETDIDYPGDWWLTAHAVCSSPLTGLVKRSASSAVNATDYRTVTASCHTGEVMVGMGYQTHGGEGDIVIDDYRPNGDEATAPTSVTLYAYEADLNLTEDWDIVAHAICASELL